VIMSSLTIAGREEEKSILQEAIDSPKAELIAVYGRRRIGKTFLIRTYFKDKISFELSGSKDANMETQLFNFSTTLAKLMQIDLVPLPPANWPEAFLMLVNYIEKLKKKGKKVIFFDELPWLDTLHSGFLSAFDYFWNSWCSKRSDII